MQMELLSIREIQARYKLSRHTSKLLATKLPHITIGHKGLGPQIRVMSIHVEILLGNLVDQRSDLNKYLTSVSEADIEDLLHSSVGLTHTGEKIDHSEASEC